MDPFIRAEAVRDKSGCIVWNAAGIRAAQMHKNDAPATSGAGGAWAGNRPGPSRGLVRRWGRTWCSAYVTFRLLRRDIHGDQSGMAAGNAVKTMLRMPLGMPNRVVGATMVGKTTPHR